MSRFLQSRLSEITAYTPGEQPRDKQYIKLNTNESPYPPSPLVLAAIDRESVCSLRLYFDPTADRLKEALAEAYGVQKNEVFVGNGSDEILNFAFMAYGERGVAYTDITYGFYEVFAELHGLSSTVIPLKEDFTLHANAFIGLKKLIVLASPNAPTGIELSLEEVEHILVGNPDSVILLDQAYVDFGGTAFYKLYKKYKNLLTIHTFSKSRSLAGGRLGFAIGNGELIADLEKIKYATNPYNVNTLTQMAGIASLKDSGYYEENARLIVKTREKTAEDLRKLGFTVLPSKANFLFASHKKKEGEELYLSLKERGILVRHFKKPRIDRYIRITVGTPQEMQIFTEEIAKIIGEKE